MSVADVWRTRLRADLTAAMKARDADAVSVLRTLIAAIDNAEAIPVSAGAEAASAGGWAISGASTGVGSTEAARRVLTDDEVARLIASHLADYEIASEQARTHGHSDRAERLQRQAETIRAFVGNDA